MSGRAARLTPAGIGGLHVWSLEDVDAAAFLDEHFQALSTREASLIYGRLVEGEEVVDEVLVRVVDARRLEISLHGGAAVDARVAALFRARGCEVATSSREPSESRIAAEAREALARCRSARGARMLLRALDGDLERALRAILDEPGDAGAERLDVLLRRASYGQAMLSPLRVVLSGPVNAGKSTLFNRLAATDRVITSAEAGTTRDAVEAPIELDGYPFRLVDTAGLRRTDDLIEQEGILRAAEARRSAGLVVEVREPGSEPYDDGASIEGAPVIRVLNKIDLGEGEAVALAAGELAISALSGDGVDELAARLIAASPFRDEPPPTAGVPFTERQVHVLASARAAWKVDRDAAQRILRELLG